MKSHRNQKKKKCIMIIKAMLTNLRNNIGQLKNRLNQSSKNKNCNVFKTDRETIVHFSSKI